MRVILTPLLIILIWLTLMLIGAIKADDFVEFDEFGNPIESTEIPLDQIPPDTRPPVVIPKIDTAMNLHKIVTEKVNITKTLQDSTIFEGSMGITSVIDIILDNDVATIIIVDKVRGIKTMIDRTTKKATIVNLVTGEIIKTTLYTSELPASVAVTDNRLAIDIKQSEQGIKDYVTFIETAHPRNYISDLRTLQHMKTIQDTEQWREWQTIFAAEYPVIEHIRIPDIRQIKMIAEMKVVEDQAGYNNLVKELKHFKSLGYNTVLAVWEGERLSDLVQQISLAKSLGYQVFFAFGKREKLTDAVFIDPKVYKHGLMSLASLCDGYLVGWRRTSLHLLKKQEKFVEFSMQCVRESNPQILIFGECYFGFQGNNNPDGSYKEDEFSINVPANASGAIIVNFGFVGIRLDKILKMVRAETTVPLLGLVVGDRPYYMTRNNNKLNKEQNREIIEYLENRFRGFDCGTATLAGDGSNEIYDKNVSDDLCKSQWSK